MTLNICLPPLTDLLVGYMIHTAQILNMVSWSVQEILVFWWVFFYCILCMYISFSFLNSIPKDTSPELRDLLLKMLKRNAKDRIEFGKLARENIYFPWQSPNSLSCWNTKTVYPVEILNYFTHVFQRIFSSILSSNHQGNQLQHHVSIQTTPH